MVLNKTLSPLLICLLVLVPSSTLAQLAKGDILVNEVMFNPLPGGADYVELYNHTDKNIPLGDLRLARMDGDSVARLYKIADSGFLAPKGLIAITTDEAYVRDNYSVPHPDRLVQVTSMPAYNDASGCVAVASVDTVILDRFDYTEKMHSRLLRDVEGVALERRSTEAPTDNPSNWYSAASTAGFGTPTHTNSQSHEFLFLDDDFMAEPTVFSPDGDGYNDLLNLTYDLGQCDLSANITVMDRHGRVARNLARGAILGCHGTLTWDGADDNGALCPRGNYVIVVESYNENGAKQSWRRTIVLVRKQ